MGRASDARERLVAMATQLLHKRSYGAVGVDALCRQARVNKGSFYYFFPSKSELAIAALEHCWLEYRNEVLEPSFLPGMPPLERLARFLAANLAHHRESQRHTGQVCGCIFGSLGCELSGQDETIRRKIEEILTRFYRYFEPVLQEAWAAGLIEAQDIPSTVKAMVAYLEGVLLQAKISNNLEIMRDLMPYIFPLIRVREQLPNQPQPARAPATSASFANCTLDFID